MFTPISLCPRPKFARRRRSGLARIAGLLACGLLAAALDGRAAVPGLADGDFEQGKFASWTTASNSGTAGFSLVTSNPHAGSVCAEIAVTATGTTGFPSLTHTTFEASANSTYELSLWGRASTNRPNMRAHISSASGPTYTVNIPPSSAGWNEYHYAFKAAGTTTISFTFETVSNYFLDDIQVYDETDPTIDSVRTYLWQWGQQARASKKDCWVGGDNDVSAQLPDGRVAWLYNDSFINSIDYTTNARGNGSFVRNYVVVQDGSTLTPLTSTTFFTPSPSAPTSETASSPIYWPSDAIVEGNTLQVFLDEVNKGGGGNQIGQATATLSLPGLTLVNTSYRSFGHILLDGGDGYLYIYSSNKVARVPVGSLSNFSAWTYFNGSTWVSDITQVAAATNLDSHPTSFERLGPNNYAAIIGEPINGVNVQFASSPAGPWTKKSFVYNEPGQTDISFYYFPYIHRETGQNGVYSIGYSDDGPDENDAPPNPPLAAYFYRIAADKCFYAPHYIKSPNLLTLSPYTSATFSENFTDAYTAVGWQVFGGAWAFANGAYQQTASTDSVYSIAKGIVETNLTYTADVTCNSGGGSGLIFRASNYAAGADHFQGYSVLLQPGVGVTLSASDGFGGNTTLARSPLAIAAGTAYTVKVIAYGSTIQAYVGNMTTPVLSVTDATYASGGIGVRADRAAATFDNVSADAVTVSPPTITSFGPVSGYAGSTVVIEGANFASPLAVSFAGEAAAVNNTTATQITATVPDGAVTGPITVTTPSGSVSSTTDFTIIAAVPVITSSTTVTGPVGQPFSYQTIATNHPTTYAATGLPDGLGFDPATGLISGTPTTAGSYTVTLFVSNGAGRGMATLALNIISLAPPVTLTATVPSVSVSSGEMGLFTLSLAEAQTSDMIVNLTIKGTAVNGTDYVLLKTTKKIKAGHTSKPIKVIPQGDLGGSVKKTVVITVAPGTGYTVGTTGKVKVKIIAP